MKSKSVKKNYIFNVSYQILVLLTPLITTPYISRILGADGIGRVSYAESIVSYFTLFSTLGITTYGQREISYFQDSEEVRSKVFWNIKILEFFTSGTALLLYLIYSSLQVDASVYFVLSLNILAVSADVTWLFQGMEEFGIIVFRNAFFKIVNIIYTFVFIRDKNDFVKYALGIALFLFLSNISLWRYVPKYVRKVSFSDLHPLKNIKDIVLLFVPTIAIQIYTILDKTMIGKITQDVFENGYYEQAMKISKMVITIVTSLGTVMIPRIGYYYKCNEIREVKRLMYRGYRFVWMLGIPLCIGVSLVSQNFIPWFMGTGYEKVVCLLSILSLLILAIGINNVTGVQYLIPTKRENIFTVSVIVGAIVNFVMNLILIPRYMSIGAAIASVSAETIIAIVQLFVVRKELSPNRILKEGISYFVAGIFMMLVLICIKAHFEPSVLNTVILIIAGMATYSIVLLVLRDEFVISNIKALIKMIRRE